MIVLQGGDDGRGYRKCVKIAGGPAPDLRHCYNRCIFLTVSLLKRLRACTGDGRFTSEPLPVPGSRSTKNKSVGTSRKL